MAGVHEAGASESEFRIQNGQLVVNRGDGCSDLRDLWDLWDALR